MSSVEKVNNTLCELIRINSTSGKEKEIILWLEDSFTRLGIEIKRQRVSKERYNLIHEGQGDFLLSCHVDTVPPAGMKDAFKPRMKDGRIYGRGSSDVKGPLASFLVAVEEFVKEHRSSRLPLSFALVVDEENNSALGSEISSEFFSGKARRCLVLEPTYGQFCTAQMGSLEFALKITGSGSHASEFEKVQNPVKILMEIVSRLERELSRKVNILMVRGGSGIYAVPDSCTALLEVKVYEGEEWYEVFKRVRKCAGAVQGEINITIELEDAENYIDFESRHEAEWLADIYMESTGCEPSFGIMPSWTDATNYYRRGIKPVIYGESNLLISHTKEEHIEVESLQKMVNFFRGLLERLK